MTYHLFISVVTVYPVVTVAIYSLTLKKICSLLFFPWLSSHHATPPPKKKKKVVREIREQKFSCIHTKALFTKHKRVFLHYLDYREWVPCACSHQSISHIVSAKALQKLKIQSLKAHRHITHRCEI